ncbi:MAG TPA: amidohydrolase family protein [Blastocatellia bacterium]|nr:amidohydrolase family protein [Blastocatellia bacterium]HMX25089.1 amidohydrolase family protein [Blastocatellia bacterium]HMY75651.1 amidohydrolase family protein [Blastocatellia bacterium]HMZ17801.1 amidohydrolase family protein [Blastocatellia bacterium]HNG30740.1 amidohydrolase family protein [Blastocatellia bacterium]
MKNFVSKYISSRLMGRCLLALLLLLGTSPELIQAAPIYDLVILNGRVIDPESRLDAVRHLGIRNGKIQAISKTPLKGRVVIDATGLVVAPGFIDQNTHPADAQYAQYKAMDGVTTMLELENGPVEVAQWYAARAGKSLINYGASVSHTSVRIQVMNDPTNGLTPVAEGAHTPASETELAKIKRLIERGLQQGAVAVGLGLQYTPGASRWEVLELFRIAAKYDASCHVHMRYMGDKEPSNSVQATEEVIAAAAITGAPLNINHITSIGLRVTPKLLQMVSEAKARGLDITAELYPYTAGMTNLASALFDPGWQEVMGIDYSDLQWTATGERLTAQTFAQYRQTGGGVILHSIPLEAMKQALTHPLTIIASDGSLANQKGHPRAAGSYARVLGQYVREEKLLSLMEALRKMTLLPAQRLERRVPTMKRKGRLRVGADADIVVFDASRVKDRATYEEPANYSGGFRYVFVNGVAVVKDGQLRHNEFPGQPVRAKVQ